MFAVTGHYDRGPACPPSLVSIDADDDPLLARFVDLSGAVVTEVPAVPGLAWLEVRTRYSCSGGDTHLRSVPGW
jgi:hypothetical protein